MSINTYTHKYVLNSQMSNEMQNKVPVRQSEQLPQSECHNTPTDLSHSW
jgi:hypothetical protein